MNIRNGPKTFKRLAAHWTIERYFFWFNNFPLTLLVLSFVSPTLTLLLANVTVLHYIQFKIAEVCHSLERDLHILGVTAIEDRLQVYLDH